jgi:hypothetical protein
MAAQHLVRARGAAGAPLLHLDLEVLRAALSRLLHQEWEDASLIVALVVDGTVQLPGGQGAGTLDEMMVGRPPGRDAPLAGEDAPNGAGGAGQDHPLCAHLRIPVQIIEDRAGPRHPPQALRRLIADRQNAGNDGRRDRRGWVLARPRLAAQDAQIVWWGGA